MTGPNDAGRRTVGLQIQEVAQNTANLGEFRGADLAETALKSGDVD